MTITSSSSSSSSSRFSITVTFIVVVIFFPIVFVNGFGSSSTIAIISSSRTVCGIIAGESNKRIECYRGGNQSILIQPNISYEGISGGKDFFCGLISGGFSFLCWNSVDFSNTTSFQSKRVYFNSSVRLTDLTVGDDHVCAIERDSGAVNCWRGENGKFPSPQRVEQFLSITSGRGFSCGILMSNRTVRCWGSSSSSSSRSSLGFEIQTQFGNTSMSSLISGDSHVCGLSVNGSLICKGSNDFRQLDFPFSGLSNRVSEYSRPALGTNHSCAIRFSNGTVVCWGGGGRYSSNVTDGISFESIVAGSNFTCGLTTSNLSLICWGPGWSTNTNSSIPLPKIIPGPCTQSSCSSCGMYADSNSLCSGSGNICKPCQTQITQPPLLSPPKSSPPQVSPRSSSSSKSRRMGFLAFAIVGSIGGFSGICTVIYCLWTGVCCGRQKKIHNSVLPTITRVSSTTTTTSQSESSPTPPFSRSSTIRRQSSRAMKRQRSGPSSKHPERAEDFSFSELAFSTDQFSLENKIGGGSFGSVYKGKLRDGREVAIKRGENGLRTKKFQEKEIAFQSELAFLSRLHHKHLVGLVGFCEDKEERLLVYEYMKNGALYDHLHSKNNIDKTSSLLNSWKMRIKISLDAARGIEYLHNYAVPPIIHRDIKSSNILLDSNWTAKVSDFGLSLLRPEGEGEFMSIKAAGTVGYIDPEYYGLHVLTAKSDVYGFGVVLLELLTGKRAILKDEEDEGNVITLVDYVVPKIMAGELWRVLDVTVGKPEMNEAEAVELVAYTALHCVNVEGKDRPTIADIVANLERALTFCEDVHEIVSAATFSSPS